MSLLTLAGTLVRALAQARQATLLYPPRHPDRTRAYADLLAGIQQLRTRVTGDPTLFVYRHAFYLGTVLLATESLRFYRLADECTRAGVESITFEPDVQVGDVQALVEVLLGQRPLVARLGGIGINQLRPVRLAETAWQERLRDLRRAYAAALDIVRDASVPASGTERVDLGAAHKVVSRLADEVGRDPGYGLLLSAIKSHDEYTYHHMVNVCVLSVALAQLIGLHRDQVVALGVGGLFHDIGKLSVPVEILRSVGPLTEEEWRLVQRHPVVGAGLVFSTEAGLYHPAATVVLEHHAAYDASGYPDLNGRRPSLPARLVAVTDCFDAVTTRRSYREPLDRDRALRVLDAGIGRGFDPRAVTVFRRMLGTYPVGMLVRLDSGEVGVVVRNNEQAAERPTVLVLLDATGSPAEGAERDLTSTGPDGSYHWSISAVPEPGEVEIDLSRFVATGVVDDAGASTGQGGLVHEPAPGEAPPAGYVDTHHHGLHELPDGIPDPDVAPPFEP